MLGIKEIFFDSNPLIYKVFFQKIFRSEIKNEKTTNL